MEMSGERHAPAFCIPVQRAPDTHWIGELVGPEIGRGVVRNNMS